MKLKLSNLSMIEMVGTAAVVLSLMFVGVEIRDSNREARAATIQSTLSANLEMSAALAEHAGTWDKVVTGEPLASGEEFRRSILLFNMLMTESENRFLQFQSGYLDIQSWEGRRSTLGRLVSLPIFELWRNSPGATSHSADFLEDLDELANNTHE